MLEYEIIIMYTYIYIYLFMYLFFLLNYIDSQNGARYQGLGMCVFCEPASARLSSQALPGLGADGLEFTHGSCPKPRITAADPSAPELHAGLPLVSWELMESARS